MRNPLFSVLIANYNNGKYLRDAIDSVIAQQYDNWQIVIVDDGSNDDSLVLYKEYSINPNIKVIYNERNRGVTYSKKRCIDVADGKLCGFLDADDALMPEALKLMVDIHMQHENVSVITSRHYLCDNDMVIKGTSKLIKPKEGESYLTNGDYRPAHFTSFKKEKYLLTKGLNDKNKIGDDQELLLLLEEVGSYYALDSVIYKYRQHNNSLGHSQTDECVYWNAKVFHEACIRRGLDPNRYAVGYYLNYLHDIRIDMERKAEDTIRRSKAYRMGKSLLKILPFKNMFNKK